MTQADLARRIAGVRTALLAAALPILVLATCTLLAGCGGGDAADDKPDVPSPTVHCHDHPERCA